MTARALRTIFQFKVVLKKIQPPVWRRFQIVSSATLADLHRVLQVVMGWTDSHMHMFCTENERYGVPDIESLWGIRDESKFRLDQVFKNEKAKLAYLYDLGDDWEHDVLLEKIIPFNTKTVLPQCLTGKRACPVEDVGGVTGYEYFLEAIFNPSHPEHDERLEWVGGDFDPEHFDVAEVNYLLKA